MSDVSTELEAAIPPHLRVERTRPLNAPKGFSPAHASYSARFHPSVLTLPMVYYGVQYRPGAEVASRAIEYLRTGFEAPDGPAYWSEARFVDGMGYANAVFVGYWEARNSYNRWQIGMPDGWWYAYAKECGDIGVFRESYTPSVMDTETTFSHPCPEGYARIADRMSGKTDTHEYWGSARDRIPRSQTDGLEPSGAPTAPGLRPGESTLGRLIAVEPHDNLCLLHSGQDWSRTKGAERAFYLETVKPLLDKGMGEISTDGAKVGCYFNRFMTIRGGSGPLEKTYSLSAWHSLADLENWVRADTHLAIWAAGIKHFKLAGETARLHLYHEMMVLKAKDQSFQYFNCHHQTGMLNAIKKVGDDKQSLATSAMP